MAAACILEKGSNISNQIMTWMIRDDILFFPCGTLYNLVIWLFSKWLNISSISMWNKPTFAKINKVTKVSQHRKKL